MLETFCFLVPKSCQSSYYCLDDMAGCAERTDRGFRKIPVTLSAELTWLANCYRDSNFF